VPPEAAPGTPGKRSEGEFQIVMDNQQVSGPDFEEIRGGVNRFSGFVHVCSRKQKPAYSGTVGPFGNHPGEFLTPGELFDFRQGINQTPGEVMPGT
jgi:hypothetical protein